MKALSNGLRKLIWLTSCAIAFYLPLFTYANNQCGSINCDCNSLPLDSWQKVCLNQQASIKQSCTDDVEHSRSFCSIHGPGANYLPFEYSENPVEVLPQNKIKHFNSQIAAMYWSLHADLNYVKSRVKKQNYNEATELLRIIDNNIDGLFNLQRQITVSWSAHKHPLNAVSAWNDYSEDTLDAANDYYSFADYLWQARGGERNLSSQKELKLLTYRVLRVAGKLYEQAGVAFSSANAQLDAAQAWKKSAATSMDLINHKSAATEMDGVIEDLSYYRLQAAARLHRASFHAVSGRGGKEAIDSLNKSNEFMEMPGLKRVADELAEMEKTNSRKYYAGK